MFFASCLMLFDSLEHREGNKVTVFRDDNHKKETGSTLRLEPGIVLVETGESRTPRPEEATQNILQAWSALLSYLASLC